MNVPAVRGNLHDVFSRRILLPLARARQVARPRTRPTMSAWFEGLRFRERALAWSDDSKRAWILNRLRDVLRRATRDTVYSRELFARVGLDPTADFTFDDYARLPVLDREAVHRAGRNMLSSARPPHQMRPDATGGSTGKPMGLWLGPEERGWRDSGTEAFMRRIRLPAGTRIAYLWGHHLDRLARDTLRARYQAVGTRTTWLDRF